MRFIINFQMIEYFRLNIEYLRPASGGSIIKKPILKMTEQSDIHKYSIVNSQFRFIRNYQTKEKEVMLL